MVALTWLESAFEHVEGAKELFIMAIPAVMVLAGLAFLVGLFYVLKSSAADDGLHPAQGMFFTSRPTDVHHAELFNVGSQAKENSI